MESASEASESASRMKVWCSWDCAEAISKSWGLYLAGREVVRDGLLAKPSTQESSQGCHPKQSHSERLNRKPARKQPHAEKKGDFFEENRNIIQPIPEGRVTGFRATSHTRSTLYPA